ncbi:MAG: phage integrase N-terminal SAM-like domain-containing protein [Verrucomicrobia bacterium]|nr:phage integrase N-terminal SAM-like domain-containing protein [Verrucomicrobiota bacterium]
MSKTTYPSLAKFADFVQLKDYRHPTKDEYVRYVRKLGEHYACDPATLTQAQVLAYFLFLRQKKQFGGSAMKLARSTPLDKGQTGWLDLPRHLPYGEHGVL